MGSCKCSTFPCRHLAEWQAGEVKARKIPISQKIFESADRLCIWPLARNEQVDGSP
jgi:hypothetical protein